MNKKSKKIENLRTYIIGGAVILLSIVLLFVIMLIPRKQREPLTALNCSIDDIELAVGEIKTDFYRLSHEDALLSFLVDKEGVIEIDDERIVAVEAGVVNVTATVALGEQSITEMFVVSVFADEYSLVISPISNCEFEENILYLSGTSCQFDVDFLDKNGASIGDIEILFSATNGATIQKRFGVYRLIAQTDCVINFEVKEFDFSITVNVIKNKNTGLPCFLK